ncbi:MAG TPA: GntR family transcriptional regulator [Gemmatimonadaceae bacterium]|jgi:DNA-binding transcriptional regulator YhcF (GntR family)
MERRLEIADLLRRRVKLGIHAGSLTPGDRLPSTRELASDFAVDHRVVVAAYHQLVAEGLVEMRPRGGIYVATIAPGAVREPMPPERWLREVFVQGRARDMSMRGVIDALRRATETVRLRAVVLHGIADQRTGMCRELEEDYGFEAMGVSTEMLGNGHRPSEIGEADLIVSTPAYEPLARRLAAQHEKPCIIADVRSDLIGGEWRLLLRKPVYVVVRDAQFKTALIAFFANTKGKENLRVLVVSEDDLSAIPATAPTYITHGARDWLDTHTDTHACASHIGGRMLPNVRTFASSTADQLIAFILKSNFEALSTRA